MKYSIIATLVSFLAVVIICPYLIPYLTKLKLGQTIRYEGPKTHYKKAGTPTMGGIAIIIGLIIGGLSYFKYADSKLLFAILITCVYGLIGFLDDYIKMVQKKRLQTNKGVLVPYLGMTPMEKLILQFCTAGGLALYAAFNPSIGTTVVIPFVNTTIDLGWWFIPFAMIAIVGVVNAANLTDGLDGLACGVTLVVFIFFLFSSLSFGYASMGVFSASIIGATMGFLCFNAHPAQVFMGDTGSMALGGAVAAVTLLTRTELFICVAGLVYLVEAISVVLQIAYYKKTGGKRLFKMAPIHHHFELSGWEETKIVVVFWVVTGVMVLISLLTLPIYI